MKDAAISGFVFGGAFYAGYRAAEALGRFVAGRSPPVLEGEHMGRGYCPVCDGACERRDDDT